MKQKIKINIILFLIMVVSFTTFGFKYFPTLDDNNQYGVYYLRNENIFENVIMHYKSYTVRPLAFFTDAYIFSNFWENMYIALIFIVILHFFSLFFLKEIFDKININYGWLAIILFGLSPFLSEATYWISASSRVVVSLFLCVFSNYILVNVLTNDYTKGKKITLIILAILLNILSTGYYEQTIVFNFVFTIFVLICLKKYKWTLVPVFSTFAIGGYYLYFMSLGNSAVRSTLTEVGIFANILNCIKQIANYLILKQGSLLIKSFISGCKLLIAKWWIIPVFIGLAIYLFKCLINYKDNNIEKEAENKNRKKLSLQKLDGNRNMKKYILEFVIGIIIFVAPFAPFFILSDPIIVNRNFYLSYIGFAMIAESILLMILCKMKNEKKKIILVSATCSIIAIIFGITLIAEVNNYKMVYEFDTRVAESLLTVLDDKVFEEEKVVFVKYAPELLQKYKTSSSHYSNMLEIGYSWAVRGKLQVVRGKIGVGNFSITAEPKGEHITVYIDENFESSIVDNTKL